MVYTKLNGTAAEHHVPEPRDSRRLRAQYDRDVCGGSSPATDGHASEHGRSVCGADHHRATGAGHGALPVYNVGARGLIRHRHPMKGAPMQTL